MVCMLGVGEVGAGPKHRYDFAISIIIERVNGEKKTKTHTITDEDSTIT